MSLPRCVSARMPAFPVLNTDTRRTFALYSSSRESILMFLLAGIVDYFRVTSKIM